ncbi:hypothetical protein [Pararhizobium mangrovi]|uniref:Tat pathway signal sequence domain protein n=1 Tax=Pararhizobium mangrovi TaxID=2590452 RepID=A0A506U4T9_9HYPH|nr:hypothetical protein [Pararhizobium mangrovi]TPW26917.1 hypothetical protein FJU11_13160 [Pararhizobium mangrovi]
MSTTRLKPSAARRMLGGPDPKETAMRMIVLMAASATLAAMPIAASAADCPSGSDSIFKVEKWSADKHDGPGTEVSITYRNVADAQVEIADATAWFEDVLGQSIGGVPLNPDPKLAPGRTRTDKRLVTGVDRLTITDKAYLKARICVDAVLWKGGKTKFFDGRAGAREDEAKTARAATDPATATGSSPKTPSR